MLGKPADSPLLIRPPQMRSAGLGSAGPNNQSTMDFDLTTWLRNHNLGIYAESLSLCVSTASEIQDFDEQELDELIAMIGMTKLHARILRKGIEQMRLENVSSSKRD
jgi:hypothetical protein